jgi:nitrogen regulatory protein PII
MFMVMLILNNPEQTHDILDAWEAAGAPGVTILPSTGIGHVRAKMGLYEDIPLMPSLDDFFREDENLHRTLFTMVRERAMVDALVQATNSVLGDLSQPHIGILAVLPVLEIYGINHPRA